MPVFLVPDAANPGPRQKAIGVEKSVIMFGRHPGCDIILRKSARVSRKHCCLVVVDNQLFVRDLKSTNGTLVNGEPVDVVQRVKLGDELKVGESTFRIASRSPDEAPPTRPGRRKSPVPPVGDAVDAVDDAELLAASVPVVLPESGRAERDSSDSALPDDFDEFESGPRTDSDENLPLLGYDSDDSLPEMAPASDAAE